MIDVRSRIPLAPIHKVSIYQTNLFVWQVYHTVCRAWAWVCPRAQVKLRRHGWFYSNPPFHSLSLVRPHTNWVTKLSLHVHSLFSINNSRFCIQKTSQKDIAPKQLVPCANDPTSLQGCHLYRRTCSPPREWA